MNKTTKIYTKTGHKFGHGDDFRDVGFMSKYNRGDFNILLNEFKGIIDINTINEVKFLISQSAHRFIICKGSYPDMYAAKNDLFILLEIHNLMLGLKSRSAIKLSYDFLFKKLRHIIYIRDVLEESGINAEVYTQGNYLTMLRMWNKPSKERFESRLYDLINKEDYNLKDYGEIVTMINRILQTRGLTLLKPENRAFQHLRRIFVARIYNIAR